MTRTSIKLRFASALLLCAGLAGCSSDDGGGEAEPKIDGKVGFAMSPLYSAFDGNSHTYKVPALLDQALFDTAAADYIDGDKVKWDVDSAFASVEKFADYPGAIVLTTKKAGTTKITATATTKGGKTLQGTVELKITDAKADEWQKGEERYNNNVMLDLTGIRMMAMNAMAGGAAPAPGAGGFPMIDISMLIPRDTSCAQCHNNAGGMFALTVEHTPLQTGGYSDDELIQIFTKGTKPMGAKFNSPILNMFPAALATTIYTSLHTWTIPPEVERGIVYKLRSIPPKKQDEIDLTRIRMGFMGAGAGATPPADGAAPATPPTP